MKADSDDMVFRARVRYAECDAHGELFMASCVNYFSEAAAIALRRIDVDLRAMTTKTGALRERAVTAQLHRALGYDDQIEVVARLEDLQPHEFTLTFDLTLLRERTLAAQGQIRYVTRASPSGGKVALPADLQARLPLLGPSTSMS